METAVIVTIPHTSKAEASARMTDGPDVPASILGQCQSRALVRSDRRKSMSRSCVVTEQPEELDHQRLGGQANGGSIGAKMGASEEPAGPILDVAAFESCQQGERNFRGVRDRLQREPATLPLIPQMSPELVVGCIQDQCRCSISHRGLTAPSEFSSSEVGWRRRQPFATRTRNSAMTIRTPMRRADCQHKALTIRRCAVLCNKF